MSTQSSQTNRRQSKRTQSYRTADNFDWLSERYATADDLEWRSKDELRIMRNWIFARHGYSFKSEDLQEYFSQFPWYYPESTNVTHLLNQVEKANIEKIKKYE